MLAVARSKAEAAGYDNVTFATGDAEDTGEDSNRYDVVINRHLVWTLPHPEQAIAEWKRVLKPGGRLIILEGNWHYNRLPDRISVFFGRCLLSLQERRNAFSHQGDYGAELKKSLPMLQSQNARRLAQVVAGAGFASRGHPAADGGGPGREGRYAPGLPAAEPPQTDGLYRREGGSMKQDLLTVERLSLSIGGTELLHNLAFSAPAGQITCLVGESGSGKSLTVASILGLLPREAVLARTARITFRGESIFSISQDPINSLYPAIQVGKQLYQMAGVIGRWSGSCFTGNWRR